MKVGTGEQLLSNRLNLQKAVVKKIFNRTNTKFMPLQYLYPDLYVVLSFDSSYVQKITEVKLPSNSRVPEFIQVVKYPVRKDIDADLI